MTEIVHLNPAWRDRANFIIAADVSDDDPRGHEQIWARQLSATTFEVCCIPFVAYDLALGDIVEAKPDQYVIERVVSPSGHYTFRVWLSKANNDEVRDGLVASIDKLGATWEWMSPRLIAIDVNGAESARGVADLLWQHQQLGDFEYETGRTRDAPTGEEVSHD